MKVYESLRKGKIMSKRSKIEKGQAVMVLHKVCKSYKKKSSNIKILTDVSVEFYTNKFYALVGDSGCGKSTLIKILGLIENCDSGEYLLYNENIRNLDDNFLSNLRMKNMGFIFQGVYLNPTLKAYENVMVPMLINKEIERKNRKLLATEILEKVGLAERINHFPGELSGGEQQRVALARALVNNPSIILADEPTGNLDKKNEEYVFKLLKDLSQKGKCVVVVSHSDNVRKYADEVFKIIDGKLVGDSK
ncbi:MAG: ABC transporter ATP-binding protein [bacterium]|nr:ABC transporter ATP-binding protein [bacterium]